MLSTHTIFALRDRFDGRSENVNDRKPLAIVSPTPIRTPQAPPHYLSALPPMSQPMGTQFERRRTPRLRPVMTAVPHPSEEAQRGELSAMQGILLGVVLGASCWGLIGSLIYRLIA